MKRLHANKTHRRGNVLLLSALLLPILLGMVAFSIDIGYMVVVKGQLQHSADSAALAGVSGLLPLQLKAVGTSSVPDSTIQAPFIQAARDKASQFAALNIAGGVSVTIPTSLKNSDVIVGYQDTTGFSPTTSKLPNAVQVTVRRDESANNPVPLFFAPLLGVPFFRPKATATAALLGNVTGFKSIPGVNGKLLPIAVDANFWKNTFMTSGNSTDGKKHDDYTVTFPTSSLKPPNNVTSSSDEVPEFIGAYGDSTTPGNFGLISIGPPSSSDSTFSSWVTNGPSSSDIQYLNDNNLLPITPSSSGSFPAWDAGPGLKSNLVTDMNSVIGQPRLVPLFSSYGGQGNNAYYDIVGFAGVTIVQATGNGNNIQVTLQPMAVIDPTAVASPPTSGSGTGQPTTFVLSLTN